MSQLFPELMSTDKNVLTLFGAYCTAIYLYVYKFSSFIPKLVIKMK